MKNDNKPIKIFTCSSWVLFILGIAVFVWHIFSGNSTDKYWFVFFLIAVLWFSNLFVLATYLDE